MADFKVGDVVQLKSGGPVMTITYIDGGKAVCEWFDNNTPASSTYPVEAIEKYEAPGW